MRKCATNILRKIANNQFNHGQTAAQFAHYQGRYEARMLRALLIISGLFITGASFSAEDARWPGLPPDCWIESRNVHSGESVDLESTTNSTVRVYHVDEPMSGERIFSQNAGYFFVTEGDRPTSTIHIFNEKDQLWAVTFQNSFYPLSPSWINEKLLFVRVYGGRVAFTDLILNVEDEVVIYTEQGFDGFIAMQQFKEGCKALGGCKCIEQE